MSDSGSSRRVSFAVFASILALVGSIATFLSNGLIGSQNAHTSACSSLGTTELQEEVEMFSWERQLVNDVISSSETSEEEKSESLCFFRNINMFDSERGIELLVSTIAEFAKTDPDFRPTLEQINVSFAQASAVQNPVGPEDISFSSESSEEDTNVFRRLFVVFLERSELEYPSCLSPRGRQRQLRVVETSLEVNDSSAISEIAAVYCQADESTDEITQADVENIPSAGTVTAELEACIRSAVAHTGSCRAYDKSGFHERPSDDCTIEIRTGSEDHFFAHKFVEVVSESYRRMDGRPAGEISLQELENTSLSERYYFGEIGCTNSRGTGRTCETRATVRAYSFPIATCEGLADELSMLPYSELSSQQSN
jgi:hypothetical protein